MDGPNACNTVLMNKCLKPYANLIDTHFSLQWCRENIVVPLGVERNDATGSQRLTVAIGNFSYLATIGDFIKAASSQCRA